MWLEGLSTHAVRLCWNTKCDNQPTLTTSEPGFFGMSSTVRSKIKLVSHEAVARNRVIGSFDILPTTLKKQRSSAESTQSLRVK